MEDPAFRRYVQLPAARVVAHLVDRPGGGPSFHLCQGLWLVPVTWQRRGRLVACEVRVRDVTCEGGPPTEVLLVADEPVDAGAVGLLDALLAELDRTQVG